MNKRILLSLLCAACLIPSNGMDMREYELIRQEWMFSGAETAIPAVEKQIKKEKKEALWYELLDDIYQSIGEFSPRIQMLEKALRVKKISDLPALQFRLGKAYFEDGQYHLARSWFEKLPPKPMVQLYLQNCHVADSLRKHPSDYTRQAMEATINTPHDNLWPSITLDNQLFCTTVVEGKQQSMGIPETWNENIYIALKNGMKWEKTKALPSPINTQGNEGASCFSSDGHYMFFVRCQDRVGLGSCDIYYIYQQEGQWSDPIHAGQEVNSPYWESTPCLSPSGKTLYFSSNRPGGCGGQDIWKSDVSYLPSGQLQFSKPINLGPTVNTRWDELSPFVSADGKDFFFSSNGWPGMGGLDIFKASLDTTEGKDSKHPENMGFPLNTYQDEMGFRIHPDGKRAYLSAPREDLSSEKIIYEIQLPADKQSSPMICLQGKVINASNGKGLSAWIELYDPEKQILLLTTQSEAGSGRFSALLPPQHAVELTAQQTGYTYASIWVHPQDSLLQVSLYPLVKGSIIPLQNLYFEWNQATPLPSCERALKQLVAFMLAHPEFHFELVGHTDLTGDAAYNQKLSVERAKSVAAYCIQQGVEAQRIQCSGKGSSLPIDTNETAWGRQRNRRMEVILH